MKKKQNIVVWFSCGAASAVAAKITIEIYGDDYNVIVVNNPVDEEHPDNRRFLKDVEKWIGQEIVIQSNTALGHNSAQKVWEKERYMSGIAGAPCTGQLKREARFEFERKVEITWHVLGFTADELSRHIRFKKMQRSNILPVLIESYMTKKDCMRRLMHEGIEIPVMYKLGFDNANCIGCPKADSPNYWNNVRRHFPSVFEARRKISDNLGVKLVKYRGKRISLNELQPTMRTRQKESLECGIFCEIPGIIT